MKAFLADDASAEEVTGRLAHLAHHEYERLLQNEEQPELIITLPAMLQKSSQEDPMLDATLIIQYSVPPHSNAVHYFGSFAYTHSQVTYFVSH